MPWKKENGQLAMQDGNPILIRERDGKTEEVPVDGDRAFSKIDELNNEAAKHRRRASELEDKVKPYEGLDAEKAREALVKVADLERKKLIDAGEVDKVRTELKTEFETVLTTERTKNTKLRKLLVDGTLSKIFEGSPLFAERLNEKGEKVEPSTFLTPAHAMRIFGEHFEFDEDLKVTVKGADGRPILSKKNPGENADPLEALELIIAADPKRDTYTRGSGMSGSGATGNHTTNSPSGYDPNAPMAQRAEFVRKHGAQAA